VLDYQVRGRLVKRVNANRAGDLKAFAKQLEIDLDAEGLALLDLALTHPTYAMENGLPGNNQRLEFLGDAVLNLAVTERLYRDFPCMSEGELTRLRAAVVCGASLAEAARQLGLGELLLLGKGEERNGGRYRPSNLADALEAVAGGLYLAAGLPAVHKLVDYLWGMTLGEGASTVVVDSKTRLQELVQKNGPENVTYRILAEWGPDHDKRFRAGVFYRGKLLGTGEGRSKKEAEQQAARAALERLEHNDLALT